MERRKEGKGRESGRDGNVRESLGTSVGLTHQK